MNGRDFSTLEHLEHSFRQILLEQAEVNGVDLQETASDTMFHTLIKTLYDRNGDVVILLDEYDKPILSNISLKKPVSGYAFSAYEIEKINPLTLLLQTGYLTIDKAIERYGDTAYMLCFPNLEVKGSFEVYLAGECSDLMADQVKDSVYKLADRFSGSESTSIRKPG